MSVAGLVKGTVCAALMLSAGACAPRMQGDELAEVYRTVEAVYRSEAKFRTDYAPPGFRVDSDTLAGNFLKIAFETEEQTLPGQTLLAGEEIALSRWIGDIRYAVYGASPEDRAHVRALSTRIGSLIGRSIAETEDVSRAEIKLLVVSGAERDVIVREIGAEFELPVARFVETWNAEPAFPCIGSIVADPVTGAIGYGLILIKSELQGDFRRACLTEEFVQALGLINDAPDVRPSIFNDDQEFIELTRHDEYLLRILYDRRLRIGMSREQARPVVRRIARELVADADDIDVALPY